MGYEVFLGLILASGLDSKPPSGEEAAIRVLRLRQNSSRFSMSVQLQCVLLRNGGTVRDSGYRGLEGLKVGHLRFCFVTRQNSRLTLPPPPKWRERFVFEHSVAREGGRGG